MISEQLEIIIQKAFELAKNKKHEFLTLEHLLLELCEADDVKKFFSYKMVNIQYIKSDLNMISVKVWTPETDNFIHKRFLLLINNHN